MKNTAQVVVIGGGVVGCSVLYHLTKLGWTDVLLVERSDLTSGSTWHAAGGFHTLNGDTNMAALQGYTIKLYKELEDITGMSCGLHHVGGLTLADNQDRFDMLLAERAKHRFMGLETEIVGIEDIRRIAPLTNTEGIIGALYDPLDGHLDPSGTTHAYAKAARLAGAEIETQCMVTDTHQRPDGSWNVVTEKGIIHAEHVVNAGGLWAREVGKMAGIYFPLHPMEHQYLVTDDIPLIIELMKNNKEHAHVVDPSGESYLRQEGRGICIGFYEQPCRPWAVDGTPWEFGHELLPDNFEKIENSIEFAYKRYPELKVAGIKSVIHGPFTFAPDGNPLVGPVPGMRNYWAACGVMAGFSQGGGVGLSLAQWMIDGEPERNVIAMDVARFGNWITPQYTRLKVIENYQKRFSITYPNEELPAARPHRTTAMYHIFSELGAVWGQQYGLEVVNYFAKNDDPTYEEPTFRRSNAFRAIGREVDSVRKNVGINEIHNFGKYLVSGPQSRIWLDQLFAGRLPKPGRIALSPMLSPKGKVIGDFTVSCLEDDLFQLTASYGAQAIHMRWFETHLSHGVHLENISDERNGFQIAGPNARVLLDACVRSETTNINFLDVRPIQIGHINCVIQRISYTGDLGYEIYCKSTDQHELWQILNHEGERFGLRPFGMRAMMSLRLDRFFGSWLSEFSPDYTAAETGLDRFIAFKKNTDFVGRDAAFAERSNPVSRRLCAFIVEADDADVQGDEPIWLHDVVVGFCTSGGYSHWTNTSVALGFLPTENIKDGLLVDIEILGELKPARVVSSPLFDPDGSRMRQ